MKRALLLPSYLGGGFGHIGRCLALADELSRQDWTVAMVLAGSHVRTVREAGYSVFSPWFPIRPRRTQAEPPAYTCILDGNIQAVRDGFTHTWHLFAAVAEMMRIVHQFRPHILIGDLSLLTWILGQRAGLPVVQIVRSIMHPAGPPIIWWQEPPPGMVSPNICPVFAPLLRRWNLNPACRVQELLRGDLFLIPSIPQLEPLPDNLPDTHYIGDLVRQSTPTADLPIPWNRSGDKPVVYVTLGGGAGPVGSRRFFQTVNEGLGDIPGTVIVSTGRKFDPSSLPSAPSNLLYYQWVPGPAVIQRSDLVVFHGGYGTLMETVRYGVPSVVLPFHSEQEGNGRRLAAWSAARVLSPASTPDSMRLVRSRWAYGEFATWIQPVSPLTPEELHESVVSVLKDPHYRAGAKALSSIAASYQGATAAAELIKRLI